MLGDNFFYGQGFYKILKKGIELKKGTFFLAYNVQHRENYAVIEKRIIEFQVLKRNRNFQKQT